MHFEVILQTNCNFMRGKEMSFFNCWNLNIILQTSAKGNFLILEPKNCKRSSNFV